MNTTSCQAIKGLSDPLVELGYVAIIRSSNIDGDHPINKSHKSSVLLDVAGYGKPYPYYGYHNLARHLISGDLRNRRDTRARC